MPPESLQLFKKFATGQNLAIVHMPLQNSLIQDYPSNLSSAITQAGYQQNKLETVTLKQGEETQISCVAYGSRSETEFVWKQNGVLLKAAHRGTEKFDFKSGSNYDIQLHYSFRAQQKNKLLSTYSKLSNSESLLKMSPDRNDNGSLLECNAFNRNLPDKVLKKTVLLNVMCEYSM